MSVKERIKEYCKYKNIPISTFEKKCKLSNGYVNGIRKGFSDAKLEVVLRTFPDLNRIWLITGDGNMLITADSDTGQNDKLTNKPQEVYLLPVSALAVSLSDFVFSTKNGNCERVISPIYNVDFAITVSGDSMAPEYPNGSRIFVKKIDEKKDFVV